MRRYHRSQKLRRETNAREGAKNIRFKRETLKYECIVMFRASERKPINPENVS
jgi:hypothetical protein